MALTVALPLSGLEPESFSTLSAKLLYEQNLRNSPDSGRASPSAGSDSSGVSSLGSGFGESATAELTSVSSRPETPTDVPRRSQERKEEKADVALRVTYKGRDILNLGANIRESCWQMRNPTWFLKDEDNYTANRLKYHCQYEKESQNNIFKIDICSDCGFYEHSSFPIRFD